MVLPAVAMHQLSMSLHMPAHAAEGVSPAALVLFREFLVGLLHHPKEHCMNAVSTTQRSNILGQHFSRSSAAP
jgi:hypothetical protein